MISQLFFRKIDNAQIIVFRVFLGLLLTAECWGAIATGWVRKVFVDPEFTFTFLGFEWTRFLLGETMYYFFAVLGALGLLIAVGLYYRASMFLFAAGWSLTYFMQKSHYNNHYYLLMLVCWIMVFLPAHRYRSLDVRRHPGIRSIDTYNWNRLVFIAQLLIVYVFAALAKLYPGWYTGQFLHIRLQSSARWFEEELGWSSFSALLADHQFAWLLSLAGIGFDFLIVPLLLWRRTRTLAFSIALLFHLFNSITLQIGIFPYFALAMSVFCFPPETIRKRFLPSKEPFRAGSPSPGSALLPAGHKFMTALICLYLLWQVYLPVRHWFIPGDVLWTEEGHRMSWRMMLRSKSGTFAFSIEDLETGRKSAVQLSDYLTQDQIGSMRASPDMIWQFAQLVKEEHRKQGRDVAVYVDSRVAVNGSASYPFIDPAADLGTVKWRYFSHQDWILDPPETTFPPKKQR